MKDKEHCPYCGGRIRICHSSEILGDIAGVNNGLYQKCENYPTCDAYATYGCIVADRYTRGLRVDCHTYLDALWREHGWSRTEAYKWFAEALGMTQFEAHVGFLNEAEARILLDKLKELYEERKYNTPTNVWRQ